MSSSEIVAKAEPGVGTPPQPPRKARHKQWGTATLGVLVGIAGLAAGRLGQLYPHFDVFSQFGAQFVAAALGFGVALFMARYKGLIGVTITVALLVAYGAWPHLVSTKLQPGPFILSEGEDLARFAHFNTYKNNHDYQRIADEVLRLDADVTTLLEMNDKKKKGLLPLLRGKYAYIYDCAGIPDCDMAIVSKHPFTSTEGKGVWIGPPFQRVVLGGKLAGITVYGVHTTRFPYSRSQLKQVQALSEKLAGETGPVVMLGDFNTTLFSRIMRVLEQGGKITRITELPTWPTTIQLPQLAIDHAFISGDFRVAGNEQIGEAAGSDHYPIVMTLAFKPGR